MEPKYEIKRGGEDAYIERISDKKRIADVTPDGIKPSAPAYYKIIDELERLVDADASEDASDISTYLPEPKPDPERQEPSEEPPMMDIYLGDRTPEFVIWLTQTDPEEAARRYKGKKVEAYDEIINQK